MASQSWRNDITFHRLLEKSLKKGGEIEKRSKAKVNRNNFCEPFEFGFLSIKWVEVMKSWTSIIQPKHINHFTAIMNVNTSPLLKKYISYLFKNKQIF